jgi:hypothetical protein
MRSGDACLPGLPGVAYDQAADNRSFSATRGFLAEVFATGRGDPENPRDVTNDLGGYRGWP